MEVEAKVLEAVALLRQAGRMDLLKDGALAPGRPERRASAGVAAAVAACSPPRVAGACKVRGASRGRGRGVGKGRFSGRERGRGYPRVSREAGHGILRQSWKPARKGKAGPCAADSSEVRKARGAVGGPGASATSKGLSVAGRGRRGKGVAPSGEEARGLDLGIIHGEGEKWGSVRKEVERNPRVPMSKKWPTMLQ
ncbi:hypothetical protein NDU88_000882 [Pleurodeles waltl]|uniref:Uncharacterized protein n=1 Tax=Pleurodeles waltl TaxID=8319 RepID=A0AAV7VVC4_PLEWA|nr:hypothetical protein NDU88_000882 [Pleurodeles waltl]